MQLAARTRHTRAYTVEVLEGSCLLFTLAPPEEPTATCMRCLEVRPESALVLEAGGRLCHPCEAAILEAHRRRGSPWPRVWALGALGVVLALAALV